MPAADCILIHPQKHPLKTTQFVRHNPPHWLNTFAMKGNKGGHMKGPMVPNGPMMANGPMGPGPMGPCGHMGPGGEMGPMVSCLIVCTLSSK